MSSYAEALRNQSKQQKLKKVRDAANAIAEGRRAGFRLIQGGLKENDNTSTLQSTTRT